MRHQAIVERARDGLPATHPALQARHELIRLATNDRQQLLDITELVVSICTRACIGQGTVTVASRHTTAAIVVQENEPLLLQDLTRFLQRIAPESDHYCHNDMAARVDVPPDERPNGHSHVRALLLPSSAQLVITGGSLDLGRYGSWIICSKCQQDRVVTVLACALELGFRYKITREQQPT